MPKTITAEYTEDQMPCIVGMKSCGCYSMAYALDDSDLQKITDGHKSGLIDFLEDQRGAGIVFEIKPASFVQSGGLTFNCKCATPKEVTA